MNAMPATIATSCVGRSAPTAAPTRTLSPVMTDDADDESDDDREGRVARREGEDEQLALVAELGDEDRAGRDGHGGEELGQRARGRGMAGIVSLTR